MRTDPIHVQLQYTLDTHYTYIYRYIDSAKYGHKLQIHLFTNLSNLFVSYIIIIIIIRYF